MATVHVGANADPHPSIILVRPEGWPVPTEGGRASSTSPSSSGASAPLAKGSDQLQAGAKLERRLAGEEGFEPSIP